MFYLTTHSTHFIYGYMASGERDASSDSQTGLEPKITTKEINKQTNTNCKREERNGWEEMFNLTMH